MKTVTPEDIFTDDKWINGYCSDIEVELGMTRAVREPNERDQASTDGDSRIIQSGVCRPFLITERAGKLKLARKIYGKSRSKKNLEPEP